MHGQQNRKIQLDLFLRHRDSQPQLLATEDHIFKDLIDCVLILTGPSGDLTTDFSAKPVQEGGCAHSIGMQGRTAEGKELFTHLLSLGNDLGLFAEEYEPVARRQLGNFPQAFSHVGLIYAALALSGREHQHRESE